MNKLLERAGERVLRRVLPSADAQAFYPTSPQCYIVWQGEFETLWNCGSQGCWMTTDGEAFGASC